MYIYDVYTYTHIYFVCMYCIVYHIFYTCVCMYIYILYTIQGVYSLADLKVSSLAIHNKELTLTYIMTGTVVEGETIKATRGTFKVYPSSYRFIQVLIVYYCFITAVLLLYYCFTTALLLLYYCFTTALHDTVNTIMLSGPPIASFKLLS